MPAGLVGEIGQQLGPTLAAFDSLCRLAFREFDLRVVSGPRLAVNELGRVDVRDFLAILKCDVIADPRDSGNEPDLAERADRNTRHVDGSGHLLAAAEDLLCTDRRSHKAHAIQWSGSGRIRYTPNLAGYADPRPTIVPAHQRRRSIFMADIGFDGKVAIITGAGGGLGRHHALELASRGARLVINDLGGSLSGEGGDAGPAQRVVQEILDLGGEAVADGNSVATAEGGKAIVQTAVDAFGTVDILVNNAGILRDKSFHNLDQAMIESVIQVHLLGAFNVTQPAFQIMRGKGYGRIVSTSSNSGILGNFGQANYGAAKMGLVGLTRVLAIEGRKNNIKANAIAPVALTRMTEEMFGAAGDALDPALVSPLVAYLSSDACEPTGEIFSAAGGIISRFFIGLTPGYYNPNLTAEDVAEHLSIIRDETGYIVPEDSSGEISKIVKTVMGDAG